MTDFLKPRFSVGAKSNEAQKNFRDNWERTFGKKEPEDTETTDCDWCGAKGEQPCAEDCDR